MTKQTKNTTKMTLIDKLDNKIKSMKKMEKAFVTGAIVGAGLMIAGAAIDSNKLSTISAGGCALSAIGWVYSSNKKNQYESDEYWEKERQKHDERYSELNDFVKEYSGRK